jgi:hypothetical protein
MGLERNIHNIQERDVPKRSPTEVQEWIESCLVEEAPVKLRGSSWRRLFAVVALGAVAMWLATQTLLGF